MKLTRQALKQIIKEELEAVMNEAELDEGMSPDHPDYDMLGGMIQRVLMAVLMRNQDVDSAMDDERVPEEHRDYVRQRVMAMSGR
tara:strand:- start:540 stop:794 length:255 start_codon:yes stop_codon:yes gene_type:complete